MRIRYEEKKPEVEVSSEDEATPLAGRLNPELFLKTLSSELEQVYRPYLEQWLAGPYIVNWGRVGFSLRVRIGERPRTVFEGYPTQVMLVRQDAAERAQMDPDAYRDYRARLATIPEIARALVAGRTYVNTQGLTPADIRVILEASDCLAAALLQ